jgi:hypothetical protein
VIWIPILFHIGFVFYLILVSGSGKPVGLLKKKKEGIFCVGELVVPSGGLEDFS